MKTAKQRAQELHIKFFMSGEITMEQAKETALIAVDEILYVIDRDENYQNTYSFFLKVKDEIEKL